MYGVGGAALAFTAATVRMAGSRAAGGGGVAVAPTWWRHSGGCGMTLIQAGEVAHAVARTTWNWVVCQLVQLS